MTLLEVNRLTRTERDKAVLLDVSFTQQPFEKIAIAGETGSGKTTLLKSIAGLVQPDSGHILFRGKNVVGPLDKLIPGHPSIGYLSQHFELRNNYRVEEELEAANLLTAASAENIYHVCRIKHLLKRKTNELSGGERQRIVLARLLTTSPELILLDEPFSNLDASHRNIIKAVLHDVGEKLKISCLLVSHDPQDVLAWADTILVMREGKIIQTGSPKHVYGHPVDLYCAVLFGAVNLITEPSLLRDLGDDINNSNHFLIRPEHVTISEAGHEGHPGIIRAIRFQGNYSMLEVVINNQVLLVQIGESRFDPGQTVSIQIPPTKVRYIPG